MQIVDIVERTVPISRFADPALPSGGLTTSVVAVVTDATIGGASVVGFGFSSVGRFAQGGLIRERFAPRLLAAAPGDLRDPDGGNLDPVRCWTTMMAGEKPGGHGDRSVAVGTLDMAIWDAAAKISGLPLHRHAAARLLARPPGATSLPVYAGGGYYYPSDDLANLTDEVKAYRDAGYRKVKIKIGGAPLVEDMRRIEAVLPLLETPADLAVDAMYAYDRAMALDAANTLKPLGLWWFEDICDPLDFETHEAVAGIYPHPIASGEALFSGIDVGNLLRYGGLRNDRDILLMDPAHCYGLTEYARIVEQVSTAGWPAERVWPHGGHLFTLHVATALGLGGSEVNPTAFQPFGGLGDDAGVTNGMAQPPEVPGIGFEARADLAALFRDLVAG